MTSRDETVEDRRVARRRAPALVIVLAMLTLAACSPAPPTPAGPPTPPAAALSAAPPPAPTSPSVALPASPPAEGPAWFCDVAGARAPIAIPANVDALCRRHPEMGPCKYERDACRARGGRVYTARGEEVTAIVEAEYDRRVLRVRLSSDGAPAKK